MHHITLANFGETTIFTLKNFGEKGYSLSLHAETFISPLMNRTFKRKIYSKMLGWKRR